MELKEKILKELETVIDPELGLNIVDLGLIYDINIDEENSVNIKMTLTTPGCPLHDSITSGARYVLEAMEEVNEVNVQLVWEPAWSPELMSNRAKDWLGRR
ncbi:putative metal-sulfur cluster biosynthetic enzyme [Schinkia azotoformans MEV2011]|uniref:Putative metal-sulfur cluster biosynthetic enzyme n=1 Tax=Schinkia azotoformans MEV2011 TaxID=1348973 RepID=A0A072NN06_SCHAZ|nr:metal-sulfur cluster assembly factor [Schinkia azotoformans]KEF38313.1 putative metal-sulfur cluster biosynthetic enzyme [Schinkia azotoformans MEV2011]MEC1694057.1 metal-sulfur cluster assembly factor [Schinkia azotoformans]MEC1715769.1 metal-sulfur cluster assembly factor [Schinkia azotoformans]MEC1724938.1 metal-sulfur cluster assembly factor [Schinkia azotoformans]MEC1741408.1 metal-sulfur cluster assembly factor [Schinkia azotoformans]